MPENINRYKYKKVLYWRNEILKVITDFQLWNFTKINILVDKNN